MGKLQLLYIQRLNLNFTGKKMLTVVAMRSIGSLINFERKVKQRQYSFEKSPKNTECETRILERKEGL